MCIDPFSITAAISSIGTSVSTALAGGLGTALTVGGGVISAYSQYQNGKAQARAANETAKQQDKAALEAVAAGERENDLQRRRVGQLQGDNRAALAASGVDVNSGAAIELLKDTRWQAEEDAFAIRENATRNANTYGQQAANSRADAASAKSAGMWGSVGTVLGTATKVGDRYKYYYGQKAAGGAY